MTMKKLGPNKGIKGLKGKTVGSFWSWAYSDVMSNVNRSAFAEYMVACALGVTKKSRIEWDAYDIEYDGKKIEVKASAYLQSWPQNALSTIRFDIGKKQSWVAKTGEFIDKPIRIADCYVFCLYPEKDKRTADVLEVEDWKFYVIQKKKLEKFGNQKSIGLNGIRGMCKPVSYRRLKREINGVLSIK